MKKFIKQIFQYRYFPIYLFIICFIAYGVLIPWLGSYADDLSFLFYFRTLGRSGLLQLLHNERPMQGLLYSITMPIFGTSPVVWQIFALIAHWLSALALWFMLNKLWPANKRQNAWITALFAIFPGFVEHWVALTYGHLFLSNAITFLSIGLMLWSFTAKKNSVWLTVAALFTGALNLIYSEYFYGIEFARIIFIWLFMARLYPQKKERLKNTLKKYLPYFILLVVSLFWRFFIFQSGKYNIQVTKLYGGGFFPILWGLIKDIALGFYNSAILVWVKLFQILGTGFNGITNILIWAVIGTTILFSALYFTLLQKFRTTALVEDRRSNARWRLQALLLGILCLILSIGPFVAGGNKIGLDIPNERFLISFAFPASLLLVIVFDLLQRLYKPLGLIAFVIILGLSIGRQFTYANTYRKALVLERSLFWQLSWRIPQLEPGTILMTQVMDLPFFSENQLSANLNLLYEPGINSLNEPYVFAYTNGRIRDKLVTYKPDQSIKICDRVDLCFTGNTSDVIAFYYTQTGCVNIVDPVFANENSTLPEFRLQLHPVIPYSKLNRIFTDPANPVTPASDNFGPEPVHDWCYYFEKADLARQKADWQTVVDLWNQASEKGYAPTQIQEYFPFIEAYAHVGDWDNAVKMSQEIYKIKPLFLNGICDIWTRVEKTVPSSPESLSTISAIRNELNCGK
jgi:hypothetical protein